MKCKHCFFEFLKSHTTCSYCGNRFSLFNKKIIDESEPIEKDNLEVLRQKIAILEKENGELKEQIKLLNTKLNEQNIYHISYIDKLDGIEFEEYIKILLEKLEYENVYTTPSSNDYGVDVIAEKDGIKYAFQCKNYKENLGNKCVQEIYSGKNYYKCQVGIVITNSYFTPNAIQQAKSNGIILWDRNRLIELLDRAKKME